MAQTPANRQFSALKGIVARYVGMEDMTDAETEAGDGINLAIDELNKRVWNWNLTSQDITLVAGTATYTLNDPFKKPRSALFLDSSSNPRARLNFAENRIADGYWQRRDQNGRPRVYTIYNDYDDQLVTLIPAPGTSFVSSYPTLRLRFYRWVQALSADGDTIAAPRAVEEYLVWAARTEMAANHDRQKLGYSETRREKAWRRMVHDDMTEYDWWSPRDHVGSLELM